MSMSIKCRDSECDGDYKYRGDILTYQSHAIAKCDKCDDSLLFREWVMDRTQSLEEGINENIRRGLAEREQRSL